MDDKHEECGICAASTPGRSCTYDLYQMMLDLQHRGQAGAGITTYDPARKIIISTYKRPGLVSEVFSGSDEETFRDLLARYSGEKGIGHTRYGTSGNLTSRHVQPFERVHGEKAKWFSFGFNGHIANRPELEKKITEMGYHLMLDTDTELLMHFLSRFISDSKGDIKATFKAVSEVFDGAYNITFMDALGNLVVIRDPHGIRPLSALSSEKGAFVSSETCALYRYGIEGIRDVEPGEMAIVSGDEITYERYAPRRRKAMCFFEYLYFASVTSEIDNRPVYEVRKRCGQQLARLETQNVNADDWVIIPVPNTSRPIAKAYSRELGLSQIYDEGLIASGKGRTFIDEGDRSAKVRRKFLPIPSVIRNKKVIVIDDSIVRSTTMATIVRYQLKEVGGAKEVHVRIATPPIIAPCYYGIDMKGFDELLAAPYQSSIEKGVMDPAVQEGFAKGLGADSLVYMTHEGLLTAIGAERSELCMACLDRNYPTPAGAAHDKIAYERFCRSGKCISSGI